MDFMAAQGAAMLGLGPAAFGPEQMSRFGAQAGGGFPGLQGAAAEQIQRRKQAEDRAVDMFLGARLGPGGEVNVPISAEQQAAAHMKRAERARNLAGQMELSAYNEAKDEEEFKRQMALADAQRQIAVTQSLLADRTRVLTNVTEESKRISRWAAENSVPPATQQNLGRP
jgi:hypothetical protein